MLGFGVVRNLAVIGLVAVSCGGTPQGTATSPSAALAPTPTSNHSLEIVRLKGSPTNVVRDISDILHPTTLTSFDGASAQFVSATEVSFVLGPTLMRMQLSRSPKTVAEPRHGLYSNSYAWSPNGQTAAYVTNVDNESQLRVVGGGPDRAIASLPTLVPTHGCVDQDCADQADIRLLYSPSGAYISFVQNLGGPSLRIWSSNGNVLASSDSESATMSAWSANSLYFRDDKGVEVWRNGGLTLLLPGVAWIRPKASPTGGQIVYATRDGSGTAHVLVLDTNVGKVREIAKSRSEPAFLNSHLVWYKEERPCASVDTPPCGGSVRYIETGKTYIYDVDDTTETESIIAGVLDVWPHPA